VTVASERSTLPVLGDPPQLKQLLLNILMNALEAIDVGGEIAVRLAHSVANRQLTLEITDTGPGVPVELLPKIFEAFITTKPEGSGLGLAICRAIADAHHATIRAENNSNRSGMSVVVEFPILEQTMREPAANDRQTLLWSRSDINDSARSESTLS
jgi:signal transduction histidine kinase